MQGFGDLLIEGSPKCVRGAWSLHANDHHRQGGFCISTVHAWVVCTARISQWALKTFFMLQSDLEGSALMYIANAATVVQQCTLLLYRAV